MANRADQLRYRFAFRLHGDSEYGLGIERLVHGKISAIYSIYGEGSDWLTSLTEILDRETSPFTLVWAQRIRRDALDELRRRYDCRNYNRRNKLESCRLLAYDALQRQTTIIENLKGDR